MSADPTAGDPDGIQRVARLHDDHADAVRDGARQVLVAAESAAAGWQGAAQQQFLTVAATVPASAHRVAARLDAAATALADYAREADRALSGARLDNAAVGELRDLARASTVRVA